VTHANLLRPRAPQEAGESARDSAASLTWTRRPMRRPAGGLRRS